MGSCRILSFVKQFQVPVYQIERDGNSPPAKYGPWQPIPPASSAKRNASRPRPAKPESVGFPGGQGQGCHEFGCWKCHFILAL